MPCPLKQPGCNGPDGSPTMCIFCKKSAAKLPAAAPAAAPKLPNLAPPLLGRSATPPLPVPLAPLQPAARAGSVPLPVPVAIPKMVVPVPVPAAMIPAAAAGGRSLSLYRGDEREPGEIKRDGFDLWGESQAIAQRLGGIANYIGEKCKEFGDGASFADFVREAKNRARPTVSTSLNDGCGGYDGAYIYKVEVSGLQEYELTDTILPKKFKGIKWSSDGRTVFMNGTTLETSTMIIFDTKLATQEHAFFTKVQPDRVTGYQPKGTKGFSPMAPVKPAVKKLW
jgi:hypothetical protein